MGRSGVQLARCSSYSWCTSIPLLCYALALLLLWCLPWRFCHSGAGPGKHQIHVLFVMAKMLIRDKLAYTGSLSASLSQELIVAYRWLAYRVAYRVVASRRCGQRLGGGRRLAGRRRLGGGGGLATAALRSRFGGWRLGGRRLGGGVGGLATAAPRSQLGVCLSFSLSFSLSRSLSVLIRGHIQDLCAIIHA